jgi:hypothetical protein
MRLQSLLLYFAGFLTLAIAAMQIGIPLFRGWYKEIKSLSELSRKTIIDRNAFMSVLLVIIALLAFIANADMQSSNTGRALLLMLGLFWLFRGIWRYSGYPKAKATVAMAVLYLATGVCYLLPLIP